jgi:hypothetical protein
VNANVFSRNDGLDAAGPKTPVTTASNAVTVDAGGRLRNEPEAEDENELRTALNTWNFCTSCVFLFNVTSWCFINDIPQKTAAW